MATRYESFQMGGSTIALCPMQDLESVAVGLWFRVGGRYEKAGENGMAHFIEHMLFKGTRHRNARQISEAIEGRGGDINAFTAEEMTCYYARMSARHFPLLVEVLFDMTRNSLFPAEEFDRERTVIQEEIRMYNDQPASVAMDQLNMLLWPGHSLGRPITGTLESVEAIRRADLCRFWKQNYHAANLILTVAGRIDRPFVEKTLQPWLGKTSPRLKPSRFGKPAGKLATKPVITASRSVEQVSISIGSYGLSRHDPRRHAMRLLSVVLGENMSSRLFQTLRERHGLAYSVQSSISQFEETGAFYIQLGLEEKNVLKAVKLIRKEIASLMQGKISSAELKRAKDYAIGQLQLNLESSTNHMFWMGEGMVAYRRIPSADEVMDKLSAVQAKDISQLANDLFGKNQFYLSFVGPEQSIHLAQPASRELNAGF